MLSQTNPKAINAKEIDDLKTSITHASAPSPPPTSTAREGEGSGAAEAASDPDAMADEPTAAGTISSPVAVKEEPSSSSSSAANKPTSSSSLPRLSRIQPPPPGPGGVDKSIQTDLSCLGARSFSFTSLLAPFMLSSRFNIINIIIVACAFATTANHMHLWRHSRFYGRPTWISRFGQTCQVSACALLFSFLFPYWHRFCCFNISLTCTSPRLSPSSSSLPPTAACTAA